MQQQSIQVFSKLNTPLKIITKLNNMPMTVSDGWHNTKVDSIIVDKPIQADKQRFKITQCDNSKVYYIEPLHKECFLSTRSGWSDMIYSQVKIDKSSQDTSQMWRIVPYHHAVQTEKSQQAKVQSKPISQESPSIKAGSIGWSQGQSLGYQSSNKNDIKEVKVQQKTGSVTTSVYRLGYEFESGPQVQAYTEIKSTATVNLSRSQPSEPVERQFDISIPPRFPIKQKHNLESIDLNNDGWFFIENVKFNLVLEVEGGIDEPGMSVVLNRLNGNRNQLWKFQ